MSINVRINKSNNINYKVKNNNDYVTNIKINSEEAKEKTKINLGVIPEIFDFSDEITNAATGEMDSFVDGLPLDSNYASKLKETLHKSWKDDKFYSEKGFISNLDKILEDLQADNLEISPLINAYIKQQFPDVNITINEKMSVEFINFLFKKNSNFNEEQPYKEFSEILFMKDEGKQIVRLLDFLQRVNSTYSLSYEYLSNNIDGFDELALSKYKELFENVMSGFMNYNTDIYKKENLERLWDDVLSKNGEDIYQLLDIFIPNFEGQLVTYISRKGINIMGIDSKKALINIVDDLPKFMDLLSKIPSDLSFKLKNIKYIPDIKNLFVFTGIDNLGDSFSFVMNNVFYNGSVIYTGQSNEYNGLIKSIEDGTYDGSGLINPDYHQDNSTTTTTVAK